MPNSPAAQAGLRTGDVIQKINGQAVKDAEGVQKAVENAQVGGKLQLGLRRNQRDISVTVQPGTVPTQTTRR
jgi:S1-C subfamily serine protease